MQQYEYQIIVSRSGLAELEDRLNDLGRQGWVMQGILPGTVPWIILMRPLPPDSGLVLA